MERSSSIANPLEKDSTGTPDFDFDTNIDKEGLLEIIRIKDQQLSGARKVVEMERRSYKKRIFILSIIFVLSQTIIFIVNAIQEDVSTRDKLIIGLCNAYAFSHDLFVKKTGWETTLYKFGTVSKMIAKLRSKTQIHMTGVTKITPRDMWHILSDYSIIISSTPGLSSKRIKNFHKKYPDESLPETYI